MTLRHDHVLRTAFLVTGALGLTAAPLSAGTLHVPGDAATIQQAINAASGGDTILVAPGTYVERIDLLGKKLIVQSTDGAAVTTINGAGGGTVVTVDDVSPPGTMLRGFTITGGAIGTKVEAGGTSGSTVWGGGGIFVGENSSLQIDACVISGNTIVNPAYDVGGGVGAAQAAVTLTGCTLTGNSAEKGSALADMTGYSEFRLFDCTISDNMAAFPASTGSCAIFVGDGRSFMATDCFVTDNVGSGVLASGFVPRVTGCTFSGNTRWGCLAGTAVGMDLLDCNFLGNGLGGMSSSAQYANSFDIVTRCVFANGDTLRPCGDVHVNECTFDGAQISVAPVFGTAHVVNSIARNIASFVAGSSDVTYSNVQGGAGGTGNIDANPQWVNAAAHDYHLLPGSPCVNAGSPAGPIDGNLSVVDQGAFPLDGWDDLGGGQFATAFTGSVPHLAGQGLLVSGGTVGFALTVMPALEPTALIIGLSELGTGFKGGLIWPSLDLVLAGLVTDAAGNFSVATTWPAGVPSGTTIRLQFLVQSPTAPQGFGISNAVRATAP